MRGVVYSLTAVLSPPIRQGPHFAVQTASFRLHARFVVHLPIALSFTRGKFPTCESQPAHALLGRAHALVMRGFGGQPLVLMSGCAAWWRLVPGFLPRALPAVECSTTLPWLSAVFQCPRRPPNQGAPMSDVSQDVVAPLDCGNATDNIPHIVEEIAPRSQICQLRS